MFKPAGIGVLANASKRRSFFAVLLMNHQRRAVSLSALLQRARLWLWFDCSLCDGRYGAPLRRTP
jgi:hypothetical protein